MKNLIVYFSRKGENYWNSSIKDLQKGNTERVAEFIQKAVGGDLFEVETVKPYAKSYYECIEEAQAELGIDDSNFFVMAQKACGGGTLHGFKPLAPKDVEAIFRMCL